MENEKTTRKQLFEINLNLTLPGIPSTSSPGISPPFSKGKALGTSIPIYPELTPLQHSRKNKLVCLSAAVRLRIGWRGEGEKNRRAKRDERYGVAARFARRNFSYLAPFFAIFPHCGAWPWAKIEPACECRLISGRRFSIRVERRSDNRKYACVRRLKSSPKIVPLKTPRSHQVVRYQYLISNSSFTK